MIHADARTPLALLEIRARVLAGIREHFASRGFLEVETPGRVVCPGLEPHLVAIPAGRDRWLRTSPELHMKRLLCAGASRIYQLAPSWRGDESGPWHLAEFLMLEWYRAPGTLDEIEDDTIALLRATASAIGVDPATLPGCDLGLEPERVTVREVVQRETGIDLARVRDVRALRAALDGLGIASDGGDTWDDLFFRLFLARVEPALGFGRVTILRDYPASQSALARVREDALWPVALRFEVFARGLELANAFDELTDAREQRRRHEADREARRAAGRETPALDEAFLAALERGMPPAAGIALGVDRLIALLLGRDSVRDVVLFPEDV